MPRRRDKFKDKEIRSLVETLAESHPWLDADMLDDDEDFERLVELLGSEDRVPDSAFAEAARAPSKHLRVGALGAIAAGRRPPDDWPEWAAGRFERAEWGERQLLLRALAVCEGRLTLEILRAAEEDWSDAPIIKDVARFVDARVAAGDIVTAEELGELEVSLQPVVDEILRTASERTRAAFEPAMQEWRRSFVDVTFFKELGRVLEPDERPAATIVGSRAIAVDAIAAALDSPQPRSVLLVGDPGAGKTSLILEAVRRLEGGWLAFQASAADVNAGQAFIGMLEARVQEIVRRTVGRRSSGSSRASRRHSGPASTCRARAGSSTRCSPSSNRATRSSSARSTRSRTSSSSSSGRGWRGSSRSCA